ncbi:MAG TPA: 3'-5' exonuclease, partial [Bacillota bacterium]|nr:3'-5' exonuclease [Bacillota bacterium]
ATDFERYSKILSQHGIPVNLYSDEAFVESPEMLFLTSYLKLLKCFDDLSYMKDNFKDVFYSVARSFVYRIEDEDIIHFLVSHDFNTLEDLTYLESIAVFKELYQTATGLKEKAKHMTVSQLIEEIYSSLNLYACISLLDNPGKKAEKLDFFALSIGQIEGFLFDDLISYLALIEENSDWDIEYSHQHKDLEAVKLMTMHKSKGLQFPVVYTLGLSKRFNFSENKDYFIFDLTYGLIANAMDEGYYPTFLRYLYLDDAWRNYISERIRLFYVALTRAKEQLIMIVDESRLTVDEIERDSRGYVPEYLRLNIKSYIDFLAYTPIAKRKTYKTPLALQTKTKKKRAEKTIKIIHQPFDFKTEELSKQRYSKKSSGLIKDEVIEAMAYGDQIHHLIETVDFKHLDLSKKRLPERVYESLEKLIATGILKLEEDPIIYQEMPFIVKQPKTTVMGIIDLMIETDEAINIIDFKLKNLDDDAYLKQLQGYYDYAKTISEKT